MPLRPRAPSTRDKLEPACEAATVDTRACKQALRYPKAKTHDVGDFVDEDVGSDGEDHVGVDGWVLRGGRQVEEVSLGAVRLETRHLHNLHVAALVVHLQECGWYQRPRDDVVAGTRQN